MPRSSLAFPSRLLGLALSTTAYADGRETIPDPACDLIMGDVDGSGSVDELDRDAIADHLTGNDPDVCVADLMVVFEMVDGTCGMVD